jgi:murein L,D-transpeptidase YcbB/YkuD
MARFLDPVVVGQTSHQTPIFSDRIEHIIVNPYWNVPPSIAAAELLPIIRSDPGYFVRNGFDVFYTANGRTTAVDPFRVNWWGVSAGQVSFRQRPGPVNALGQIKFMFPNAHNVYLHDTPSEPLPARRARSAMAASA